jgi:hypothetical protein
VTSITITATVNESRATVTVNGQAVTSGQPSQSIPLNVGSNTITIVVTAQDGTTTKTYTVTATRLAPPSYTLTMAVNGWGSTSPAVGSHSYPLGTVVTITAVPDRGWRFVNWTGDVADPNSPSTNVTMNTDKTVTANFICPVIQVILHSPGELRVYDSQNRVTGLVNGIEKQEIPNSSYNSANTTVVINPATDAYYYQVVGTGAGAYGLELVYTIGGQTVTFNAINIPTLSGAIHRYSVNWDALSQGQPGVTVQTDLNGDGAFETSFNSDGTLTNDEFVLQAANPHSLKRGAIDKLQRAKTGDKRVDETIDRAIRYINDSLEEKLWVDLSHLVYGPRVDWLHELKDRFDRDKKTVDDEDIDDESRVGKQSPPGARNGITVFHKEMAAIMLLDTNRGIDRDKNEKDNRNKSQPAFEDVISDLVNADMILAKVVITDAKSKTVVNPAMNKIVSKEIESAEKEYTLAVDAANKGQSTMAVMRFSHAWLHAQLAMHFATLDEVVSQTDKVPPVTTASLNPAPNANGWNNTDVTANLTATDSGSGVKEIHYTLNGGAETIVSGVSASFLVSMEGSNNITYFARDNAGNTAPPKYVTVKIDKTKPAININSPQAKEYLTSDNIALSFSTSDNLSGIAGVTATLDTNPVNNGQIINLSKWDGSHTFTVTTIDKAGNMVTKQVTFIVKSEGARAVKNDAVAKLKNARTGDKKTDETIDRAIQLINNSLDAKLWVDPSHLVYGPKADWLREIMDRFDRDKKTVDDEDIDDDNRIGKQSPPGARNGITVFHQEMAAIMLLDTNRGIDKDKNEKDNRNKSQPAFEDVISDLVNADMMLAKVAITDAKGKTVVNPAMNKIVSKEIESAEKEYTLAVDAANKGQSTMAVTRFSHAWLHAQLAMQFATMEVPQPPPKIEPKDNGDQDKDKKK